MVTSLVANYFRTTPPPVLTPNMTADEVNEIQEAARAASEGDFEAMLGAIQQVREESWSSSAWVVAIAPTFLSDSGRLGDLDYEGVTAWTSVSYDFAGSKMLRGKAQLIGHARIRSNALVPSPETEGELIREDSFLAGVRLRFGRADFLTSVEGAYARVKPEGLERDSYFRVALIVERKIAENLWFNLTIGENLGRDGERDETTILGGVRFGSSERALTR